VTLQMLLGLLASLTLLVYELRAKGCPSLRFLTIDTVDGVQKYQTGTIIQETSIFWTIVPVPTSI
jgi:hypothetical protein